MHERCIESKYVSIIGRIYERDQFLNESHAMEITQIVSIEGHQAVKIPDEFRFDSPTVSIRKEGEAVILEPIRPVSWPANFFDDIRIDDPAFARPSQGETPPAPIIVSP